MGCTMRPIDAYSLLLRMEKRADCEPVGHLRTIKRMMKMVEEQPTVDTVKHGYWIYRTHFEMECSECGTVVDDAAMFGAIRHVPNVAPRDRQIPPYCPFCGMKADKKQ